LLGELQAPAHDGPPPDCAVPLKWTWLPAEGGHARPSPAAQKQSVTESASHVTVIIIIIIIIIITCDKRTVIITTIFGLKGK
jgi:hypothetical protein